MRQFNVTLIKPEGFLHSLALAEVAGYVHWTLRACGYESTLTVNTFFTDKHNVALCAHLLPAAELAAMPANTIIFNSEQMQTERAVILSGDYKAALERFWVWDYSLNNLPLINNDRKRFIPLLFCPELVRKDIARTPGDQLFFYGGLSPRRRQIMDAIKQAGVPVETVTQQYGTERDAQTFKAWAILNLHVLDGLTTFEAVRCFYALTNGLPVISEAAPTDPTFALYKDWIFSFDTDELPDGAAALYRDRAAFAEQADEKIAAFAQSSGKNHVAEAVDAYLAGRK